jgi:hypothetical protein
LHLFVGFQNNSTAPTDKSQNKSQKDIPNKRTEKESTGEGQGIREESTKGRK